MKTTEIVVEQVLIGFVVMFIVAVLVAQGIPDIQWSKDTFQAVAISAGLLGAAYLIGIIYDRLADTLLKDLDQHARLRIALDHRDLSKQVTGRQKDPFPEDDIRLMVQTNSSTADYADYLRTRIRLTRALATLVPALVTVWLLIALVEETLWNWAIVTIGGVYLAVLVCKLFAWPYEPPKTNQGRNANAKDLNAYIDSHKKKEGWQVQADHWILGRCPRTSILGTARFDINRMYSRLVLDDEPITAFSSLDWIGLVITCRLVLVED